MRRALMSFIAATAFAGAAHAADIAVPLDEVRIVAFKQPISTVYMGNPTIADITTFTWVRGADIFYGGREVLEYAKFPAVSNWLERCIARPASARGLNIPVKPE